MKELYENLEWLLSVILSACSCIGMLFLSCFVRYLVLDSVTARFIVIAFVVSVFLTWAMNELRMEVRYRRLEILADELEFQKNEQAQELYEHLRVT